MHFRCEVETAQTGDKVDWSGSEPLRSLKGLPHDSNGISTMVCLQNDVHWAVSPSEAVKSIRYL
jgi:hypothetical protein